MNLSKCFILKNLTTLNFSIFLPKRLIRTTMSAHEDVHEIARLGFSKEVVNYEKTRPTYPNEAFNTALEAFDLKFQKNDRPNKKINVLDLAAGSGKFTRHLATYEYFNVHAVEPNSDMRAIFKQNIPNVPIHNGTSTSIPFEDGFFQVVFIAQAFHWFSNIESLREMYRVLKPQAKCEHGKSGLLLIWNMEDRDAEPHIAELRNLYEKYDSHVPQYRKNEWQNAFESNEAKSLFTNISSKFLKNKDIFIPLSHIWRRILSKSYIATLNESEKAKLKEQVEDVIERYKHCHVKRPEYDELCLHFPYYTEVTWCFNKTL